MKGCPYDNAVAEATYKIIKTEFIKNRVFASLKQLQIELADYVNWFNNHRIHSSLDYLTPKEFEKVLTSQNVNKEIPFGIKNIVQVLIETYWNIN